MGSALWPATKLKDAVAEYRKLTPRETVGTRSAEQSRFRVVLRRRIFRSSEERPEAEPAAECFDRSQSEAALNGSAAGLAEARKRTGGAKNNSKQIAASAGANAGKSPQKYPLAADFEEAGASGDNAADTATDASTLYRKTQPHEQIVFGDDPARRCHAFRTC